jgi:hypothetical protein
MMRRIRELINVVRSRYPEDSFFSDFEGSCQISTEKKRYYKTYDDSLRYLDSASWEILKQKALNHFLNHRKGQWKQGFFNQLNEAFAYRYLSNKNYSSVTILPECGQMTPDIRFGKPNQPSYCEVKTIGISDNEIKKRKSMQVYNGHIYASLSNGFFNKFQSAIDAATCQIRSQGTDGLIYIILLNDDIALDYYSQYRKQILSYCHDNGINNLYIKIGLRGNRNIHITIRPSERQNAASAGA